MYNGKRILAVIPARAGSKRFPDKNLAKINGLTLVEHAVNVARECQAIDQIMVTTDDIDIIDMFLGSDVYVLHRAEYLSRGEQGSSLRTWRNALVRTEKGIDKYQYSVLLEPTSPNRTVEDVSGCIESLDNGSHNTVATITMVKKLFQLNYDVKGATQMSSNAFKMNGVCYAAKRYAIFEDTDLFSDCYFIDIARRVINIDYPEDLALAEALFLRDLRLAGLAVGGAASLMGSAAAGGSTGKSSDKST